jgi:hypothetical protein
MDRERKHFIVVSLPREYIREDRQQDAWCDYFEANFRFPVVVAYWERPEEWTLLGDPRLTELVAERDISALPWQQIAVYTSHDPTSANRS